VLRLFRTGKYNLNYTKQFPLMQNRREKEKRRGERKRKEERRVKCLSLNVLNKQKFVSIKEEEEEISRELTVR